MALFRRLTLPALHVSFGLTGVLHAIGGALLPALARSFHLADSRSGEIFLCYYIGTSLGALLCVGRYARLMPAGFLVAAACCASIAAAQPTLLLPLFLLLGIGVGIPMSAVNIYAGRAFPGRAAAPLTLLNFTWSAGALVAPLFAARLLVSHSWRSAYWLLAAVCVAAALACWLALEEPPQETPAADAAQASAPGDLPNHVRNYAPNYGVIALFAFLTFLEVGIENTTAHLACHLCHANCRHRRGVGCGFLFALLVRVSRLARRFFAAAAPRPCHGPACRCGGDRASRGRHVGRLYWRG